MRSAGSTTKALFVPCVCCGAPAGDREADDDGLRRCFRCQGKAVARRHNDAGRGVRRWFYGIGALVVGPFAIFVIASTFSTFGAKGLGYLAGAGAVVYLSARARTRHGNRLTTSD